MSHYCLSRFHLQDLKTKADEQLEACPPNMPVVLTHRPMESYPAQIWQSSKKTGGDNNILLYLPTNFNFSLSNFIDRNGISCTGIQDCFNDISCKCNYWYLSSWSTKQLVTTTFTRLCVLNFFFFFFFFFKKKKSDHGTIMNK